MTDSTFMSLNGIHVTPMDMPPTVRAFVVNDQDGGYCIVVNTRLSKEAQRKAIRHELGHIRRHEVGNPSYHEYG